MVSRQQAIVGAGIAAVLVTGVVGAVVLSHRGGGSHIRTTSPTSSSSTSSTLEETTLALIPVTAPSTTVAPPPAATTTSTTSLSPALSGQGAVMTVPAVPDTRLLRASSGCASLGDGTGWSVECGPVGAGAIWMVETRPAGKSTATRAYLFVPGSGASPASPAVTTTSTTVHGGPPTTLPPTTSTTSPGGGAPWQVALTERDDSGSRFSGAGAVTADGRADGNQLAIFGFHAIGSDAVLALDLVELPPDAPAAAVTVHLDLTKGRARLSTGQLDTWAASYVSGDAACCPSAYTHDVVHYLSGGWRVVSLTRVSPAGVPPSQV